MRTSIAKVIIGPMGTVACACMRAYVTCTILYIVSAPACTSKRAVCRMRTGHLTLDVHVCCNHCNILYMLPPCSHVDNMLLIPDTNELNRCRWMFGRRQVQAKRAQSSAEAACSCTLSHGARGLPEAACKPDLGDTGSTGGLCGREV